MEYLPFGETLVDEHLNSYNTPFKFNGKELDEETGNYYYGARYYNPKWSSWLSVDPIAVYDPVLETEFYGFNQHNGGELNSGNLNVYGYCYQNPINLIDPNGKQTTNRNVNDYLKVLRKDYPKANIYVLSNVGIPSGSLDEPKIQEASNRTYQMTRIFKSEGETLANFYVTKNYNRQGGNSTPELSIEESGDRSFQLFFNSGNDNLTDESKNQLQDIASLVKKSNQKVLLSINLHKLDGRSDETNQTWGKTKIGRLMGQLMDYGVDRENLIPGSVNFTENSDNMNIDLITLPSNKNSENIQTMPDWDTSKGDYIVVPE